MNLKVKSLSCVRLFATPWTVAFQAPLSMDFSRQGSWSGLSFPFPGDLPNPGIEPTHPLLGRWILYHLASWEAIETMMGNTLQYFQSGESLRGGEYWADLPGEDCHLL